jgi:hypothetical protein
MRRNVSIQLQDRLGRRFALRQGGEVPGDEAGHLALRSLVAMPMTTGMTTT